MASLTCFSIRVTSNLSRWSYCSSWWNQNQTFLINNNPWTSFFFKQYANTLPLPCKFLLSLCTSGFVCQVPQMLSVSHWLLRTDREWADPFSVKKRKSAIQASKLFSEAHHRQAQMFYWGYFLRVPLNWRKKKKRPIKVWDSIVMWWEPNKNTRAEQLASRRLMVKDMCHVKHCFVLGFFKFMPIFTVYYKIHKLIINLAWKLMKKIFPQYYQDNHKLLVLVVRFHEKTHVNL